MGRKKSRKKRAWGEFPSEESEENGNDRGRCQYVGIWSRVDDIGGIEKTKKDRTERLA